MKHWISAFRLRTLPLALSVVLVGNALALRQIENFSWSVFWLTMLTTILLQILSNLANDFGDAIKGADNEGRIGPKRAVQSGAISAKAMRNAVILFALLSLTAGSFLLYKSFGANIDWTTVSFFILGLLSILAAIKYTVGKKAYGYAGFGDLFVFIFFGFVGVLGSYYLQAKSFHINPVLLAITMGCFCVAVLNLNNMRDHLNDANAGKNTLVVKLGLEQAKQYHYSLYALAYLSFFIYAFSQPWVFLVPLIFLIPVYIFQILQLIRIKNVENPREFDPELKKTAILTFVFSLIFSFFLAIFQDL